MLAAPHTHKDPIATLLFLRRGNESMIPFEQHSGAGAAAPLRPQSTAGLDLGQILGYVKRLRLIARLLTPGELSPQQVLVASVLAMATLAFLDQVALPAMRLHILYLFPLAAIALHCERRATLMASLGLSLALQLLTFVHGDAALVPELAEGFVTVASSLLAMTLARASRANYLVTLSLAATDWLTGLYNRRSFESAAESEISRQRRYGGVFSLAVLDLDGFKKLNDTRGHQVGDAALQHLADVLRQHIRETDLIARLGGDEFVVLMPSTQAAACLTLCRQLAVIIGSRMAAAGFGVTASIGCASFDTAPASTNAALERADAALYAAKANGRNCAVGV